MQLLAFFLPIYATAFLALFLLRRPAWLAAGAIGAALLIAVLHRYHAQAGGGESALGSYLMILVAALGFAVGAAARVAIILLRLPWPEKALAKPVGLLFFFGIPLAFSAWSQVQQARHKAFYAPPSVECRSRLHQVRLGDRELRLPLMPGVTIGEAEKFSPRTSTAIPERERAFCERSKGKILRVTNIAIDVPQLGTVPEASPRRTCLRPRKEAWWQLFCRSPKAARPEIYGIYLQDAERYDPRAFPDYRVNRRLGDATVLDSRWEHVGPLARLDNDWEIFWRGPRMSYAASPWSARCYQNRNAAREPDGWRCKAGYMLTPRVALIYDFLTPGDEFVQSALGIEQRVSTVARSLVVDEGPVPPAR